MMRSGAYGAFSRAAPRGRRRCTSASGARTASATGTSCWRLNFGPGRSTPWPAGMTGPRGADSGTIFWMSASLPAAEAPARRSWRTTALVRGSLALHTLAAATLLVRPAAWPWALGAVVADHLLISGGGLLPRCRLLGPNLTRLPPGAAHAVAVTVDDGPDPAVTPQVLALLEAHGGR